MSWIECGSCEEMIDVCGGAVRLPFICGRCEKDSALAAKAEECLVRTDGDYPFIAANSVPCQGCCFDPPCQTALDSTQADVYDIQDAHNADVLDQFDADTELINGLMAEIEDLKMQLSQAKLDIQVQGEIIDDLENTVNAYRVIFRIPGY